jgi:hypothetical protein
VAPVSDNYIRVIATDPYWQPSPEAADTAVAYLRDLFAGPNDAVERVESTFYESVTFIDAGEYDVQVLCRQCGRDVDLDWFYDALGPRPPSIESMTVKVPCCGALVALDSLHYDGSPVGFARFEVSAMNWARIKPDLDDDELSTLAALLGHPVTQIHTKY